MSNNAQNTIENYVTSLRNAFASRVEFEKTKNVKENIFVTLTKLEKALTRASIAQVFMSHNVDANFINRHIRADSRMNVYAIDKADNVASALAKSETLNHFTRAILLTAKRFSENELLATREDFCAACNTSAKLKDAKRDKLLVRTSRHVSASTASSQYSSSLDALVLFNVLVKTQDKENNEAYKLNADSDATKALLERCA
jgi:hypothetical protein